MRKLKLRSFLYRYLLSTVEKLITKRTGKNDVKLIYDNSTFKDTRHKRQIYLTYKVALTDWWFQNSNLHLPTVFLCGNYNVITYCKQISTQQLMVNKNKLEGKYNLSDTLFLIACEYELERTMQCKLNVSKVHSLQFFCIKSFSSVFAGVCKSFKASNFLYLIQGTT